VPVLNTGQRDRWTAPSLTSARRLSFRVAGAGLGGSRRGGRRGGTFLLRRVVAEKTFSGLRTDRGRHRGISIWFGFSLSFFRGGGRLGITAMTGSKSGFP